MIFRLLRAFYNSKIFNCFSLVFMGTFFVILIIKNPIFFLILFFIPLSVVGYFVVIAGCQFLTRAYVKRKLKRKSLKYILAYPRTEKWRTVFANEIEPIFGNTCFVLRFDEAAGKKMLFRDWWLASSFNLNSPSVLFVKGNRKYDLWKSVRKAAYGYPTKLNNIKKKLLNEILSEN